MSEAIWIFFTILAMFSTVSTVIFCFVSDLPGIVAVGFLLLSVFSWVCSYYCFQWDEALLHNNFAWFIR